MPTLNATHDPKLRSFIVAANAADADFPIQNLPFGIFRTQPSGGGRAGIAIGDQILDLLVARAKGLFADMAAQAASAACSGGNLNALMAAGPACWSALRARVSTLLSIGSPEEARVREALVPMRNAELCLPAEIGDYSDFLCSLDHATNVLRVFRPGEALSPNFKYLPIGYHGRASSVRPSGTPVIRPKGQSKTQVAAEPAYGPSERLDYELELGAFIGPGNRPGKTIPIGEAESHIFGLVILNDWSARDIQNWESTPLGPFLGKSFHTTISPWVVTLEALAPFRTRAFLRRESDPAQLPYLASEHVDKWGGIDITVEVAILTPQMRDASAAPHVLGRAPFRNMYWTIFQMATHHASNGCDLRPGDLLGTGTISGATPDSHGCMLELTEGGRKPVQLPNGETRAFLEDGDEVIMRAACLRGAHTRIGFGECRATVVPAIDID